MTATTDSQSTASGGLGASLLRRAHNTWQAVVYDKPDAHTVWEWIWLFVKLFGMAMVLAVASGVVLLQANAGAGLGATALRALAQYLAALGSAFALSALVAALKAALRTDGVKPAVKGFKRAVYGADGGDL